MFTNYYPISSETVEPKVLTAKEKMLLTDLYAQGLSADRAARMSDIPEGLVNSSYVKKKAIEAKVVGLMRGNLVKEVIPIGTIEESGATYVFYNVPTTKTGLTKLAYTFFPDCTEEAFKYNIDMIVKWCDGKGNATWADFVNAFKTTEQ